MENRGDNTLYIFMRAISYSSLYHDETLIALVNRIYVVLVPWSLGLSCIKRTRLILK